MVRLCLETGEEGRKAVFRNGFPRRLRSHVDMRVKRRAPAFTETELSTLWRNSAVDTIKVLTVGRSTTTMKCEFLIDNIQQIT